MMLKPENAARQIYRALLQKRHIRIIDWRYRLLVPLWRLIPNSLWRRLTIKTSSSS
jgi:short-subunit dehydrogenase